jgi:FAD binding domain/Berberine and berberine like
MATTLTEGFDPLSEALNGSALAPGDEGWDLGRQAFNLLLDQRPAAIVQARDQNDVARAVRFAREHGLRVAAQSTGHNAAPLGDLGDTLLLRTEAMNGAELDTAGRRARVQAGARWSDVVPAASEHGLAALHGSSPTVGIVGYSLGGGMGWYARKHGLQTNCVTAIELVTADGEPRRVDRENDPDLFWALRGGGGSFGVVTALEFALFPVEQLYAGALFFPYERASEILHAWHEWAAAGLPEEVTSVGRVLQFPPMEEIPEPLRGNSYTVVEAAFLGSEADGVELMRPLRELGPGMDTFGMVPPVGLSELHMDPPDPVPYLSQTQNVDDLPAKAIDDLVAAAATPDSVLLSCELRDLGGALARSNGDHGARDTLGGAFTMFAVGAVMEPAMAAPLQAQLEAVTGALAPHEIGRYANFVEQSIDTRSLFTDDVYRRLQAVKAEYDPDDLIRANHPIRA